MARYTSVASHTKDYVNADVHSGDKTRNWSLVIIILLVVHAIIFWILSATTDTTWKTAGMGTVYTLRPPSWDAFQGIATLDNQRWQYNQLDPQSSMYKWGEEFDAASSAAHDCSRLSTRAFNFADFEDSVDGSAGVDSLALVVYLIVSVVTFLVITLADPTKMPTCDGSIPWFGVSAAVATWLPPITTLSITFTHNYISLSGYILLCATSLVLGHFIWAMRRPRPGMLTTVLMVATLTNIFGISLSRSSPWFLVGGAISTPIVLWIFYSIEMKSCVPCMNSKTQTGRSTRGYSTTLWGRPLAHNFVVVVIVWGLLICAHLSLAFNTLIIDEYMSGQDLPTEAIFLPRLHVVPNHCCPVAGVPDMNTPEFVIGCSLQEWGLAYTGSQMKELLGKPHLDPSRTDSPSTILAILGTIFAVSAIGSLATYFKLASVMNNNSYSNPIRWTALCVTGVMHVMLLAIFGSIATHKDVVALQLFTFATIAFMFFSESGLDMTLNREYKAEHKPGDDQFSPLEGYFTPMVIGWVGRIGLWTALLHGYTLRLSSTDEEYPTYLRVAFVVSVVGSLSLVAIQLTHVCLAKKIYTVTKGTPPKQITRDLDLSYSVRAVLFMAIIAWSIFSGLV